MRDFSLIERRDQLVRLLKPGVLESKLKSLRLEGQSNFSDVEAEEFRQHDRTEIAIICSMTRSERESPSIIDRHRLRRIARGSGVCENDVGFLLSGFRQMLDEAAGTACVVLADRRNRC